MVDVQLTPDQSTIQCALRAFLFSILPDTIEVIEAQVNRVPEPKSTEFIVMTVIRRNRLSTNIDQYLDCAFMADINGTDMTVDTMLLGYIQAGHTLLGVDVLPNSTVVDQQSGIVGGTGVYTITPTQTVARAKMATGIGTYMQPTDVTVQLDVHSASLKTASNMAQIISTLFRDPYAIQVFQRTSFDVVPLYADDPKQIPFINEAQQYESKYVVEACMQANQTVQLYQEFADQLKIGLNSVDAKFPDPPMVGPHRVLSRRGERL
jgi:hypothetical protein